MDNVLISIVVPCYNQALYLDECLQSVIDQTYSNWECIIVNDGSPDNTKEIVYKWLVTDTRFKYIEKQNGGLSSARNSGISEAQGVWILPLDADDKIACNYLELAQRHFDEGDTVIYCNAEFFGVHGGSWSLPDYSLQELAKDNLIFCTAFYKKEDWSQVGGYDENLKHGFEDWEFWIQLLKTGNKKVRKLQETCFYYRVKQGSMLNNLLGQKEQREKTLFYIEDKHASFFRSSLGSLHSNVQKASLYQKEFEKLSKRYGFFESLLKKVRK